MVEEMFNCLNGSKSPLKLKEGKPILLNVITKLWTSFGKSKQGTYTFQKLLFIFLLSTLTRSGSVVGDSVVVKDIILDQTGYVDGNAVVVKKITVDPSGHGDYKSIQEAVNSVPDFNNQWVRIHVKQGIYKEKVVISREKSYILLEGEGPQRTEIQWDDHNEIFNWNQENISINKFGTTNCSTFTVYASNFMAREIGFRNTYNILGDKPQIQAVAAMLRGDKMSFYHCSFIGFQDTLFDDSGRHYFNECRIEGTVDFIFGNGQSIYHKCNIYVSGRDNYSTAYITAQSRDSPNDTTGYVFKYCTINGRGKAYLGRPWRSFARVLFYRSRMAEVVEPKGWDTWQSEGKENQITYAEKDCFGPGSSTSGRVSWEKKLTDQQWAPFLSNNFIDAEGWRSQQP